MRLSSKKRVLLIVETSRAFGRELLRGISHHALEFDEWDLHVEDRGLFDATPNWLKKWKGHGILTRSASYAMARLVRSLNVPYIELLGNGLGIQAEVRNDETEVARLAARHFRQVFGHSIEKELIRTKINRAKRLLRETQFSLRSIAAKSGFSTKNYFTQAFRRATGMTPEQYRGNEGRGMRGEGY